MTVENFESRIPAPPPGWEEIWMEPQYPKLHKDFANGLRVLFSEDSTPGWSDGESGWWRHVSISRRDRHPSWEDQRDMVRLLQRIGFLDPKRSVIQVIPPEDEYVGESGHGRAHIGIDLNLTVAP